jgi:hypothetical protein
MLFIGAGYKPCPQSTGEVVYDINYKFLYRPQGHNNFPRFQGGSFSFSEASTTGGPFPEPNNTDGVHAYDSGELANLFILPTH